MPLLPSRPPLRRRPTPLSSPRSITDRDAFVGLFDRHFVTVHRYLHRRLGRDLADDLAAETFVRAFAARASFRPETESALPWLYGIANNLVRRHRRTEKRRRRAYARTARDVTVDLDDGEAASRADAAGCGPALAAALLTLGTDEREPLLLTALDRSHERPGGGSVGGADGHDRVTTPPRPGEPAHHTRRHRTSKGDRMTTGIGIDLKSFRGAISGPPIEVRDAARARLLAAIADADRTPRSNVASPAIRSTWVRLAAAVALGAAAVAVVVGILAPGTPASSTAPRRLFRSGIASSTSVSGSATPPARRAPRRG